MCIGFDGYLYPMHEISVYTTIPPLRKHAPNGRIAYLDAARPRTLNLEY